MAASPMPKSGLASNVPAMRFTTVLLMVSTSPTRSYNPSHYRSLLQQAFGDHPAIGRTRLKGFIQAPYRLAGIALHNSMPSGRNYPLHVLQYRLGMTKVLSERGARGREDRSYLIH